MKSRITASVLSIGIAMFAFVLTASAHDDSNVNASIKASLPGVKASVNASANASAHEDRHDDKNTKKEVRGDAGFKVWASTEADRMAKQKDRGVKEIDNRVDSLTKLQARIQAMKNLSDSQKASFAASIQAQVTALNALSAKIKADTSSTSLRANLEAIAPSYRIYALIRPQLSILAASDRVSSIVTMMQTLGTKLETRINASSTASTSAANMAKLANFKAKIADANVQAQAAVSLVINLKPDNGDAAIKASNDAALKNARAKLKLANDDIKAAYADARAISINLRIWKK